MFSKRIAFVGPHNAGKDTLSHHAFTYLKLKGKTCYYITEVAERALMRGMDINTPAGQMWLLGYQIKSEMEAQAWDKREYIICNRGVIDSIPYASRISEEFADQLAKMALGYMRNLPYHTIIFLRPFESIENDGVRDLDRADQINIDERFRLFLHVNRLGHYVLDAPTKRERQKQLEAILDEMLEGSN